EIPPSIVLRLVTQAAGFVKARAPLTAHRQHARRNDSGGWSPAPARPICACTRHSRARFFMPAIIRIADLVKRYKGGFEALKGVSLDIADGEILALLGPNGAGKTTLISIVCGIVNATSGSVRVAGHDIVRDYRAARAMIGLVPQEMHVDGFESVWTSVSF